MTARPALALLGILGATALLAGQTSPERQHNTPTFKAGVEYVEVDAVITNAQGTLITDLTKDDFQVFEDGKPQTISAFSVVNVPVGIGPATPFEAAIEPDAQTNEHPFDGRMYVMVLDDLHVDAQRTQAVRQSARQFIESKLGSNDLLAVIHTGRDDAAQDFTSNRRLLLKSVDQFLGRQPVSATLEANQAYHAAIDIASTNRTSAAASAPSGVPNFLAADLAQNAESTLSTLRQVGQWLSGVRGRRRAVLFFSEGLPYDLSNLVDDPNPANGVNGRERTSVAMRTTLAALTRSNVSVYSIDPRGLSTTGDDAIMVSGFADQSDPSAGIGLASLSNEMRLSQASLRQISNDSGGFAAVNRNDTSAVFDRIVRDNSSYYVLAYYPEIDKADGKFHRIEVRVNRPGLSVRARRGYAAPDAKQRPTSPNQSDLQDALNSPLPVSGLTIRLFAAPMKGSKKTASAVIGIELSGRDLSLGASNKVDLSFAAVDQHGKVFGAKRDTLPLNMDAEGRTKVEQGAIRVVNRIDLPPGRYRLHAAALDQQKHLVGSVLADLEVPNFYKDPFSMSGIMVTSRAGSNMVTAVGDEQLRTLLPSPVVALRTFSRDDELDLFAEVYDNTGKALHKIDVLTTVLTRDGEQVARSQQEHDSTDLKGDNRAIPYREYLPLSRLLPGEYVVKVEAHSRLGNTASVIRQVPFRVVSTTLRTEP
jgi:VWFA-related protein